MRVLGIATSTNFGPKGDELGTSATVLKEILDLLKGQGHEVETIYATKLHIVPNLGCYSTGGKGCADPKSGPYRCWAHHHSMEEPEKYGGEDQMSIVYEGLEWADVVIFATGVRWGSHTATLQTIIERMNTLENRHSVYGEANPLSGKKCGVIVTGQHWLSQRVAEQLLDALGQLGFHAPREAMFTWQRSNCMRIEQVGSNVPPVKAYLKSPEGEHQTSSFVDRLFND